MTFVLFISTVLFSSAVLAEQIIVRDCANNVLASANVAEDTTTLIRIKHEHGESITLSPLTTLGSPSINPTESQDALSLFNGISSGDWKACGGHINEVSLSPLNSSKSSSGNLLAAGTGILAGTSVVAFASQSASGEDSIANTIEAGGDTENVASANRNGSSADNKSSTEAATRCLNDSEVPDMSQSN